MNTLVRNFNALPLYINELIHDANKVKNYGFSPATNIVEEDEKFKIVFSVPGFKKEDFKIEVKDRNLTVSVELEKTETEQNEKFVRKEFVIGNFERAFKLPLTVDIDSIEASYEFGILTLDINKKEEAKPKEPRLVSIN